MVRNVYETELDGKRVGFKCGTLAVAIACRESNSKTVNDLIEKLAEKDLLTVLSLFYGAACQYHNLKSPELTMDIVSDWIEQIGEEKMTEATKILLESFLPKNMEALQAGAI